MYYLVNPEHRQQLINRVQKLNPQSPRLWGKMSHAQMLKHCRLTLELALGDVSMPRKPISYVVALLMPLLKHKLTTTYGAPKNSPTAPEFTATDASDFVTEQQAVLAILQRFTGAEVYTNNAHPMFGHLTPQDWDGLVYWHFDYHLRQFSA